MKSKKYSKTKKVNKGGPSGLVISLALHAAAFFVAGLFVVFTVVNKPEPEFEPPPPIERPKMKLKKPKVKVKKSSQPKPSSRIVAKVKTRDMPEIQLPDLMGTGEGLMGGTGLGGEFMDLPDIGQLTVFGNDVTTGNDLVGRFYDFKRNRSGLQQGISRDDVDGIILKFLDRNWNPSAFSQYYCSPKKLYASTICIGTVQSTLAPEAFGEYDTPGWGWAVLYTGKLVYPEDIKFRFRGVGDKYNAVRVDGKVVLICAYRSGQREQLNGVWASSAPDTRVYPMAESKQDVGDWIELKGGVPVDIEILIGDRGGGLVYHQLVVEVEGEDYPRNPYGGGPTCPVFKTDNLSRALIDALYVDVYPGDVTLTNGPVFCDYFPKPVDLNPPFDTNVPPTVLLSDAIKQLRTWTSIGGESLEGKMLLRAEDYVLIEDSQGKQRKIPVDQLSEADHRFMDLANPPKLNLEFSKTSEQFHPTNFSPYDGLNRSLSILDWTFGARMKWSALKAYDHELTVEYFAIGDEPNGDNFILLDRKAEVFNPAEQEKKEFEFYGRPIRLMTYNNRFGCPLRGRKMGGYIVTVKDEEDRIVIYEATNKFLFENLWKLKQLPINAHFDKHCDRTFPARPTDGDRASWNLM